MCLLEKVPLTPKCYVYVIGNFPPAVVVCLSVCLSVTHKYISKRLHGSSWGIRGSLDLFYICSKDIRVISQKISVLSSGTLPKNSRLRKFVHGDCIIAAFIM